MKFMTIAVAAAGVLASGMAFAGDGCIGSSGSGPCEVVGLASDNGLASLTTGVPTGSNLAAGASVAASALSFATSQFGTLTATAATGGVSSLAVQDLSADHGGLGVTTLKNGAADLSSATVNGTDTLTLTFSQTVQLDALEFDDANYSQVTTCYFFVFCSSGYNPGADELTSSTKFDVSVDGGAVQKFPLGNGTINNVILPAAALVGKSFTFSVDSLSGSTPFYIGAIEVCKPVPEPSTYAILGMGLAALAWSSRRHAKR